MCSWVSDLPCDPAEGTPPWHSPGCKERNEIFAQLHVFWQCEGVRVHCTECNGGCPCREPLYCKSVLGGIWSPGFSLLLCKDIIIYIYIYLFSEIWKLCVFTVLNDWLQHSHIPNQFCT